jgi:hypothetical protein
VVDIWWTLGSGQGYYKIDAETMTRSSVFAYPVGSPVVQQGRSLTTDGTYVYGSGTNTDVFWRADIATDTFTRTTVGDFPSDIADDGTSLWVANASSDNMSKVTKSTMAVAATKSVINNGGILWRDPYLWITDTITGGGPYGIDVRVYNPDPFVDAVIQSITLSTSLSDASAIVSWGGYVYVALRFVDTIYKINASTYSVADTLSGIGEPTVMAVIQDKLYVIASGDLVQVDPDTMTVDDTITASYASVIATNGYDRIWVADSTTLRRIDLDSFSVDASVLVGTTVSGIVYAGLPVVPPTPGLSGIFVGAVVF